MLRRITSIEPQKRAGSVRVDVFLDGSFGFSLGEELAAKLSTGALLSELEVAEYQREDGIHQVCDAALVLLSYRPRSISELRGRLLRRGFDPALVDDAMERLKAMGLVDDAAFAQFWVENRQNHRPRGRRLLQAELRAKGIGKEIVDGLLPGDDEEDTAAYLAAKRKVRSIGGLAWPEFRKKLGDYLLRRGFGYETAASIARRLWNELHQGEAEDPEAFD